jgi:mannose-6-phosphate isomerase-like protein (cupin superfamily)
VRGDADIVRDGYLGPVAVLSSTECAQVAAYLRRDDLPPPEWEKSRAVHERFLYELATRPAILGRVSTALGSDVVLWGILAVWRQPGQVHPWHSDIESCGPEGGFVSVWIGIEHTSRHSSLQVIAGSHRLGSSVQEARATLGIARNDATPDVLLEIARGQDPAAELVVPDMGDGDAIFFDGRLWHGTDNRHEGDRLALLLQFAAADRPIRIPDVTQLDWPFRLLDEPKPPVILVRGSESDGPNRVVAPPPASTEAPVIDVAIHAFELPLGDGQAAEPWHPFPAFRGPTRTCADMSCHASVLARGHSPHPPHAHVEEELLIPLHGEVELVIPSRPDDPTPRSERLTPGSFVYYPAWQLHTIKNPGSDPVGYLMFKWQAPTRGDGSALGTEILRFGPISPPASAPSTSFRLLLEGATGCLEKLHAHVTTLEPGAGYEAHRDGHDVAIVTLEGTVETLGRRVEPFSVVYCSAGELHGMQNVGPEAARYLVFEFHGPGAASMEPAEGPRDRIASRLVGAGKRLARPFRRVVRPIRPARARRP